MSGDKSFLDTLADGDKPESFAEEKFESIKNKGGQKKIIAGILALIIVLAGAFVIYNIAGTVKVPDLTGKSLDEATVWAQNNGVILYAKDIYSFEDAENTILTQEIKAGTSVKKNTAIPIKVSLGPDPEELITFPDIKSMTTAEIEKWISDNKLSGTKIVTAYSDVVETNHVISYTFTDGSEDSFKRKNRLTINVSIGSESLSETVVVEDFSSLKPAGVLQWGSNNGVIITLKEEFDEYVASGNVISQSVTKGTEIKRTDGITVVISKGKPVTVPDFAAMTKDEASIWSKSNNVTLSIMEKYSDNILKGKLFGQSIEAGKSIKEGDTAEVFYSLGKVDISNFTGKTKLDILNWQNEVNLKNANIRLTFTEAYGDKGSFGKIISQSIANDFINTGTEIKVVISKGMNQVEVSSFIGKTKLDIINWQREVNAENAGIKVIFTEAYGEKGSFGKIISQSIKNDYVNVGSEIKIVISKGMKVIVPDFSGRTEAECNAIANSSGISVIYDYQQDYSVPKGYSISQYPSKNTVITDEDPVSIVISMTDIASDSVLVADFSSLKPAAILQWGTDNGAKVYLVEAYDNFVPSGSVISQSIAKNTIIKKTTPIMVYISMGKAPAAEIVAVPNFSTMTKDEANSWAKLNNISLSIVEKYSNDYIKGKLYNQSTSAGSSLNSGDMIKVYYSLGRVPIGDLTTGNRTKLDALEWQNTVNEKGANISISFVNNSGTITDQAVRIDGTDTPIKNDLINVGSTVIFTLSTP